MRAQSIKQFYSRLEVLPSHLRKALAGKHLDYAGTRGFGAVESGGQERLAERVGFGERGHTAVMEMARAEVSLGAAAPFLDEVIVEGGADCTADHGYEAGSPFLGDFDTQLGGNAFDNTRDETFDDFFFDEVAAQVNSCGSRGGNPELDDFIVGRVIESVDQAEFLEHAHGDNGEEAHVGKDRQQAAHADAGALERCDFAGGFDGLFGDVVESGDREMEHVVGGLDRESMRAAEILEIGRGIQLNAGVGPSKAGFDGLDEGFARFDASWRPIHRRYCMPVRMGRRVILVTMRRGVRYGRVPRISSPVIRQ